MTVRCKFKLTEIVENHWNKGKTFTFEPVYDTTIPEDKRFQDATPSGKFTIFVTNSTVLAEWKIGEQYYFDATPVPTV